MKNKWMEPQTSSSNSKSKFSFERFWTSAANSRHFGPWGRVKDTMRSDSNASIACASNPSPAWKVKHMLFNFCLTLRNYKSLVFAFASDFLQVLASDTVRKLAFTNPVVFVKAETCDMKLSLKSFLRSSQAQRLPFNLSLTWRTVSPLHLFSIFYRFRNFF